MSKATYYHVVGGELAEGPGGLGRITVVLAAHADAVAEAYVRAGEREHALRVELHNARQQLAERDALLRELMDCPQVVESATIPKGGVEQNPSQVVVTLHVGLLRLRKVQATLSDSAEPSDECAHSYANKAGCPECGEAFDGGKPSTPKCKYCGDTGQFVIGSSGDASDGNAPIMARCEDCELGEPNVPIELKALLRDVRVTPSDKTVKHPLLVAAWCRGVDDTIAALSASADSVDRSAHLEVGPCTAKAHRVDKLFDCAVSASTKSVERNEREAFESHWHSQKTTAIGSTEAKRHFDAGWQARAALERKPGSLKFYPRGKCPECDGGTLQAENYRYKCTECRFECGEAEDE